MSKDTILVWVMFCLSTVFGCVNLILQHEVETQGRELESIVREGNVWKNKNIELKQQILSNQALVNISEKARSEGFVQGEFVYLP